MTPEEYNAQQQALIQRRAIANAMLTQSMTAGKDWGSDHYRHSPWEVVANLGSTYLNKQNLDAADAKVQDATKARQAEIAQAMAQYNSATPDEEVGAESLKNLRAAPADELPAAVTPRSAALRNLGTTALGPDKMAEAAVTQAMTPDKLTEVAPGASLYNPRLGRVTFTAPPKPPEVKEPQPLDELAKLNADFKAGRLSKADYDARRTLMTTRALGAGGTPGQGFDDPEIQDLQAAISASGYSLPAGFRSKEQQLALLKGLKRKYDGLSNDDIAHLIGSNAIDYKATSKATQTAAGIVGKVEVANKELEAFVPIAKDANAAVDRSKFVPWNKLEQLGKKNISDPDLKRLYVATQTILNAYDMLASRGGTDQDKRAHNREILSNADSPEAYDAALDMIVREGQAAGGAARAATKASAYDGTGKDTPKAGAVPDDIAALLKKHGGK
jgi:hypothetical protein